MARFIEVSTGTATATFELLEDWAPKTTALLWDILPIEGAELRHGKLSGEAAFINVSEPRLKALPERNELGVSSIYKGYMVAHTRPATGVMELLISYGLAEYRWPDGRRLVTPVAEVRGDATALFAALADTWTKGASTLSVRRKGPA